MVLLCLAIDHKNGNRKVLIFLSPSGELICPQHGSGYDLPTEELSPGGGPPSQGAAHSSQTHTRH